MNYYRLASGLESLDPTINTNNTNNSHLNSGHEDDDDDPNWLMTSKSNASISKPNPNNNNNNSNRLSRFLSWNQPEQSEVDGGNQCNQEGEDEAIATEAEFVEDDLVVSQERELNPNFEVVRRRRRKKKAAGYHYTGPQLNLDDLDGPAEAKAEAVTNSRETAFEAPAAEDPIAARICELFDEMQMEQEEEDDEVFAAAAAAAADQVRMRRRRENGENHQAQSQTDASFFKKRRQTVSGYFSDWTKWLRGSEKREINGYNV